MTIFDVILACSIAGSDSGICLLNTDIRVTDTIKFCAEYVPEQVCVPYNQTLWQTDTSIEQKDGLVQSVFMAQVQDKLMNEYNTTSTNMMMSQNPKCYFAYKKFLCLWNFPYCTTDDTDIEGTTQSVCVTFCTSFMNECGYQSDRCTTEFDYLPNLTEDGTGDSCNQKTNLLIFSVLGFFSAYYFIYINFQYLKKNTFSSYA